MENCDKTQLAVADSVHQSVMPEEVLQCLHADRSGNYLDCTLGGGGHSRLILQANSNNTVYGADRDPLAVERASVMATEYAGRFHRTKANFSEISQLFRDQKFDGVLADLGISSDQLLTGRGFSFKDQDSLDMRMDPTGGQTACDVVNNYSLKDLMIMLRTGGVTQSVKQTAEAIVNARPIHNAGELARAITSAVKINPQKKINPATLAFQAIRIEVNDELGEIKCLLEALPKIAATGCRVAIISFHSIEDQLVARAMRNWENPPRKPALWGGSDSKELPSLGKLLTKKALVPSDAEVLKNPRARSARLRNFIFH